MNPEQVIRFFEDIDSLKHGEREGWKQIGKDRPRDTIASHSFGAALLAWVLAKEEGFDTDRTVKMLLTHDLIMAYVEDYTPEEEGFESKKDEERERLEELFEDVPESIEKEFRELVKDFLEQDSREARLAKEADKLDTLLQARAYSKQMEEDHLSEFLESYGHRFHSATGREFFRELKEEAEEIEK